MMSRIAPRVQRTSLVSVGGGILKVHPAHRALAPVEGEVGLRDHRLEPVLLELVLAEGAGEEAAVVLLAIEVDHERPFELGLGEDHCAPPSAGSSVDSRVMPAPPCGSRRPRRRTSATGTPSREAAAGPRTGPP